MKEIKSIQEATQTAKDLGEKRKQSAEEQSNLISNFMEELEKLNAEDDEFAVLTYFLSLPDDTFAILAPYFKEEYINQLNETNNKLLFAQTLNATGQTVEDYGEAFNSIIEAIDESGASISQPKKDFLKNLFGAIYNSLSSVEGIAKRIIRIPIELCRENAKIPTYANLTDAGMDIYALEDITIAPGETVVVPTGLKVALPPGYELQVRPKSGRALKTKLRIANTPGTIDAGYRDEIGVIVENIDPPIRKVNMSNWAEGNKDFPINFADIEFGQSYTIGKGEKFAQLVLNEVPKAAFYQIDNINEIENDGRNGGFGSTGIK